MSEYLQLCHKVTKLDPLIGWMMSEKLDGMRCFWDGGASRGMPKARVPYANLVKGVGPVVCTGLWSRLGNVVPAPSWWLDQLPVGELLDGELYAGIEHRQHLLSWIKSGWVEPRATSKWDSLIKLRCYDVVPAGLMNGVRVCRAGLYKWTTREGSLTGNKLMYNGVHYTDRLMHLNHVLGSCKVAVPHSQQVIVCIDDVHKLMADVLGRGGEGLVIRHPRSSYLMDRSRTCLKYKDHQDAEMKIVGYNDGSGRHDGRLGSYICEVPGSCVHVSVSGMTDDERDHPLPIGTIITVRYRGLSAAGVPLEARSMGPRIDC